MYDQSNIEFINFETITHPDYDHNMEMDVGCIDMNDINDVLLERYESGNDSQYDSIFTDSRSQFSLSLDFTNHKLNDSINSSVIDQPLNSSEPKKEVNTSCLSDKLFECDVKNCNKRFKFKWILDRHYSTHKAFKMFKCPYQECIKSYKSKENLTLHIKNIHLNEKPYSCKYCKSVFSHRNGKTYHERKFHTNYLPHKCIYEDCQFRFASKSALTYHLKSHHSENKSRTKNKNFKSKFVRDVEDILHLVDNVDMKNNNCVKSLKCINNENVDNNNHNQLLDKNFIYGNLPK